MAEISCRAQGTRRCLQQGFITICRAPAHTIPVSSSQRSQQAGNLGFGGVGNAGGGRACTKQAQQSPVLSQLPTRRGALGNRSIPLGITSKLLLLNPSPFPKHSRAGNFNSRFTLLCPGSTDRAKHNAQELSQIHLHSFPHSQPNQREFSSEMHKSLPGLEQQQVGKGIRGGLLIQICYFFCSRQNKARRYQQFCL